MKHSRVFITGGSGYIGRHLIRRLVQKKFDVTSFDMCPPALTVATSFVRGDIRKATQVKNALAKQRPDVVVHLAALTRIATGNEAAQHGTNVTGTQNVLEAMMQLKCVRIVFASSAAVYGKSERPVGEDIELMSLSTYGETKICAEQIIRSHVNSQRFSGVILRLFNVAGNDDEEVFDQNDTKRDTLIANTIAMMKGKRRHVVIYGKQYPTKDGTAMRDYVHIADTVDAFVRAIYYTQKHTGVETINIGSGKGTTNLEMVRAIEKEADGRASVLFARAREQDIPISIADNERARRVLRWHPRRSFASIIAKSACRYYGLI